MTVYAVFVDYELQRIFATEALAKQYVESFDEPDDSLYYEEYEVETK